MKTAKLFFSPLRREKSRRDGTLLTAGEAEGATCGAEAVPLRKSRRDDTLLTVCFSLRAFSLRTILLPALAFFSCASLPAQVTIGGIENPRAGAILDLNSTTKGGLILSNVTIADPELIPQNTNVFGEVDIASLDVNEELRGIMVYNDGLDPAVPAGIYIWNGYCWTKDGGGTTAVTAPSISIEGAVTNTGSVVEGDFVTFAVVSPQAGVSYSWHKNTSASTSGGTLLKKDLTYNTPIDLTEGIHYYYCTAISDACPSLNVTSGLITLTVNNLHSLPIGSGTLAGRACFDVLTNINSGVGYGTPATRAPFVADFDQSTTSTQEYIFSPSGTVSRIRFYVEENQAYSGQIMESMDCDRVLKTQTGISGTQKLTVVYKNLNETAKGTDNYDALMLGIYVVYNDSPNGSGIDKTVKVTALIKDCQCCGAYVNAAKTQWLNFSCHNLGADESADPFTPAAAIHGARYKWGIKDYAMSRIEDQNSAYYGGVSDWLSRGGTPPTTSDIDWDMENDNPCPSGWRVPTYSEWTAVRNSNSSKSVGSWGGSNTNYSAGVHIGDVLFFPATGHRCNSNNNNGVLYSRGLNGQCWSSTANGSNGYNMAFENGGLFYIESLSRIYGFNVRCVID
jgi:uncharacterized protein (TIGR02145 family)